MSNAVVLMAALVPTIGHKFLIDFARRVVGQKGKVSVIVCSLYKEPIPGYARVNALRETYAHTNVDIFHYWKDVPQEPQDHPDFWNVWRDIVLEFMNVQPDDYFIASEKYGQNMADVLGCKFLPCNRYRETIPISGTEVRADLLGTFDFILPEFQHHIRKTVTLFGPESCGKTTMTKRLAKEMNGWFIPEWAREYLETLPTPETTDERMVEIWKAQGALQNVANFDLIGKPWIFQDTDLLSTYGYYKLWSEVPKDCKIWPVDFSDIYVVMNDRIPFEEDPLRYGGKVRESTVKFWIDILDEFDLSYIEVQSTDHDEQFIEIKEKLLDFFAQKTVYIRNYRR